MAFDRHGYLQHVLYGWCAHHDLRYPSYFIQAIYGLVDGISYAFVEIFSVRRGAAISKETKQPNVETDIRGEENRPDKAVEEKKEISDAKRCNMCRGSQLEHILLLSFLKISF